MNLAMDALDDARTLKCARIITAFSASKDTAQNTEDTTNVDSIKFWIFEFVL